MKRWVWGEKCLLKDNYSILSKGDSFLLTYKIENDLINIQQRFITCDYEDEVIHSDAVCLDKNDFEKLVKRYNEIYKKWK